MLNELFFARLSYIVYCNAQEISFGTCLGSRYIGLLTGQKIERFEIFTQVDPLKSVAGRML